MIHDAPEPFNEIRDKLPVIVWVIIVDLILSGIAAFCWFYLFDEFRPIYPMVGPIIAANAAFTILGALCWLFYTAIYDSPKEKKGKG